MEKRCENCVFSSDKSCVLKEIEECQNFEKYKPNYPTLERKNAELKQALIKCFDYADNAPLDRVGMVDAFGDIRGVVRETGVLPDEEL